MKTFFSFLIPVFVVSILIFMFIPAPFSSILGFSIIVTLLIIIIGILKGNDEKRNNEIEIVSNEEIEKELELYFEDNNRTK
jgi:hypothetical protein